MDSCQPLMASLFKWPTINRIRSVQARLYCRQSKTSEEKTGEGKTTCWWWRCFGKLCCRSRLILFTFLLSHGDQEFITFLIRTYSFWLPFLSFFFVCVLFLFLLKDLKKSSKRKFGCYTKKISLDHLFPVVFID